MERRRLGVGQASTPQRFEELSDAQLARLCARGRPMRRAAPAATLLALLALSAVATDAHAQSTAVAVGLSLALIACAGGALFGAIAGWRAHGTLRFLTAFLIYLGLLTVVASTRAGSLEIVPLAIVLGALAGIAPFAACFFVMRALVARLRARSR